VDNKTLTDLQLLEMELAERLYFEMERIDPTGAEYVEWADLDESVQGIYRFGVESVLQNSATVEKALVLMRQLNLTN
jgi:hypothetical protein